MPMGKEWAEEIKERNRKERLAGYLRGLVSIMALYLGLVIIITLVG